MDKRGFAIIETIIVVVMMTTSLLLVYSLYNTSITNEKKRIYYDDVVDIYTTDYLKNYILEYTNYESFVSNSIYGTDDIGRIIGVDTTDNFFKTNQSIYYYGELVEFYNVSKVMILNTDFDIISECSSDVVLGSTTPTTDAEKICNSSFSNVGITFLEYIKTLGSNVEFTENSIILVVEYNMENSDKYTYAYSYIGEIENV